MFADKVVAITGAGSGIGRALAISLGKRKAILAISDINKTALNETLKLLPPNTKVKTYIVDVASEEEVYQYADEVEHDFGKVHYIFNNAGTSIFGTVENINNDELRQVLDINLWGVIYGTKAFLAKMLKQDEGCIVNLSSVFGLAASPCQAAYNISKFAVRGFTETLWSELRATNIRAVVVHPGGINTNIKNASIKCENSGEFENIVVSASADTLVTPAEDCAEEIITGLIKGKKRLLVGSGAKSLHWLTRIFPDKHMEIIGKKVGFFK